MLRKVTDPTATDDERIEAAAEFYATLGVEDPLSFGCFLLAALKILSRSADPQGFHPLSDHFKEIDRIMDALLTVPTAGSASPRVQ